MDVNCTGTHNCYLPSGTYGVLSTSNSAYDARVRHDDWLGFCNRHRHGKRHESRECLASSEYAELHFFRCAEPNDSDARRSRRHEHDYRRRANGFNSDVTLSATGLPTGVTAAFSTNPTTATTFDVDRQRLGIGGTFRDNHHGCVRQLDAHDERFLDRKRVRDAELLLVGIAIERDDRTRRSERDQHDYDQSDQRIRGNVTMAASGLPSGVTAAFGTNPATTSSILTLTASGTATTGSATVTITGISGSLTHTTTINLTVNTPAPDFTLSSSASSLSVFHLFHGVTTITVNPLNGFTGNVNLTVSGLPSGVSASITPNPTTSTSVVNLYADDFTEIASSTITVTGTSGSLTHTTTFTLTVEW